MPEFSIPLCRPSIDEAAIAAVAEVLRSGWLAHGECNRRFEAAFAELIGVKHAISMNSCTSALEMALLASGIKGEVILPSFTFVATANAVVNAGARPVFAEVQRATRNTTASLIAERITSRTEAVIVVHFGGQPCPMDEIVALCQRYGLLLIEDSAETLGATWRGCQAGSFGLGCFSFFPTKNITTAEGGMLTCHDQALAQKIRALIAHGIPSTTQDRQAQERPWWREARLPGRNYRLPNPLACLGWHQLKRLAEMNQKRIALARRYDRLLNSLNLDLETPVVAEGASHVYQMYTILVAPGRRDQILRYLRSQGVGASVHFDPPVHQQAYYCRLFPTRLPVTERLAKEIITLPLYPDMTEADQDRVVAALTESLGGC